MKSVPYTAVPLLSLCSCKFVEAFCVMQILIENISLMYRPPITILSSTQECPEQQHAPVRGTIAKITHSNPGGWGGEGEGGSCHATYKNCIRTTCY